MRGRRFGRALPKNSPSLAFFRRKFFKIFSEAPHFFYQPAGRAPIFSG